MVVLKPSGNMDKTDAKETSKTGNLFSDLIENTNLQNKSKESNVEEELKDKETDVTEILVETSMKRSLEEDENIHVTKSRKVDDVNEGFVISVPISEETIAISETGSQSLTSDSFTSEERTVNYVYSEADANTAPQSVVEAKDIGSVPETSRNDAVQTTTEQEFQLELQSTTNNNPQVQVVVEQEVSTTEENEESATAADSLTDRTTAINTATVAAPQGVNPAMMSNLLHTAAAVAASQNAAAATVQVVPGQSTGTIQLVPENEVQNTQTLMANGIAPQGVTQLEDGKPNTQPVFTYLVTSQGTLIAAHSSDGTQLISPPSTEAGSVKKRKNSKNKSDKIEDDDCEFLAKKPNLTGLTLNVNRSILKNNNNWHKGCI